MGGKTKTQSTNQQTAYSSNNQDTRNELGFAQVPEWQGLQDYRAYMPQADPTIPYRAAAARQRVTSTLANPTGAYRTPELDAQRQMSALASVDQQAGQEARQGAYDVSQQRGAQLANIAQMTAPVAYNARNYTIGSGQNQQYGNSSGTTQGPGFFSQLGGAFAQGLGGGAARFLTGKLPG